MKYVMIVDEDVLKNFRLDDDGLTLVVHDECGATRAFKLKPLIRPLVVFPHYMPVDEQSVYITRGHIKAMKDYEKQQHIKEHQKQFEKQLDKLFNDTIEGIEHES